MRRQNTILCLEKRIILPDWLCRNNIQCSSADPAIIQCIRQILLCNERTARIIDDHDTRLHFGNILLVDDAKGAVKERAVQSNDVRCGKELIQLRIAQSL